MVVTFHTEAERRNPCVACRRHECCEQAAPNTSAAPLADHTHTQSGASFPAGGISGATFHYPDYKETDVDVEVWIQVAESFVPVPPLECRRQPAREIVTATFTGDYSQMPSITGALGAYIAEHQLKTGPMFNIYRVSPAQNPDPSSWITDVCFPVLSR